MVLAVNGARCHHGIVLGRVENDHVQCRLINWSHERADASQDHEAECL
jgi:hypothetical protein